jgi:hypothetical protein
MKKSALAVSIITYRRSKLLDLCLKSVNDAMYKKAYPVYIIIQDALEDDLRVLNKHKSIITEISHIQSKGADVEELINSNRFRAWELPLIEKEHQFVICLEDDVEVAPDIFDFTEQVLKQNIDFKNFWGINYGSFEKPADLGSYSRLRFGLHGPASLISSKSFKRFKMQRLQKFKGAIPWDSWVEPLMKTGFVATSNVSRYRDNGFSGTHATIQNHSKYFQQLNNSFENNAPKSPLEYKNKDIEHKWRGDCLIYSSNGTIKWYLKYLVVRTYQILKVIK